MIWASKVWVLLDLLAVWVVGDSLPHQRQSSSKTMDSASCAKIIVEIRMNCSSKCLKRTRLLHRGANLGSLTIQRSHSTMNDSQLFLLHNTVTKERTSTNWAMTKTSKIRSKIPRWISVSEGVSQVSRLTRFSRQNWQEICRQCSHQSPQLLC